MFLPKAVAPLGCGLMLMAASPLLANTATPVLPATDKDWALAAVAYHQLDWSTQALLDKVLTAL